MKKRHARSSRRYNLPGTKLYRLNLLNYDVELNGGFCKLY